MNSIVKLIFPSLVILAFTTCTVLAEIKSPPYFVDQPNGKEILFYVETDDKPRSFEIPCEAKGTPAPDYFWTKNGETFDWTNEGDRISQEAGKGTLIINVPKSSDAGRYQCYAKNIWGTATSNSVFARKIELGSFRNEPIMTKEAIKGQTFSLPCKPPYGYPKPSINWMIQDPLGKPISIMNPRITADPTGTLWFSNVTEKDASDDSLYACVAVSSHINDIKIGPKIILQVVEPESSSDDNEDVETSSMGSPTNKDDQEIIGVPLVKQYTSKSEEIAISNTKVRLYCIFGGTPLPTITWYKNGKLMKFDTNVSLKEGRKILEIRKSRPSDEANYTCEASNGIGDALSHTISLKILVEPKFIKKPQSVTLDEEETVEFHCQASGNPTPEIIWTYNGKPLSEAPPNPRRAVSANSIVIEKLLESDTGNYGCNASNSVGYVYQDAYVNVLAEAPSIIEISQGKEILQGETVTLKCRGEGSPKPRIIWLKNDVELTGDRFTMMKNGDLTINNVDLADMGNYICLAQNKISSINATVNLEVRQRTRIPPGSGPSDTTVLAGESAILRCSPQTDPSLDRTITWLHNDQSIDFGSENFTQANDDSLIIKHANELDAGIYSCVANTRLDSATAEASLSIQRIPYPPELLMLSCESTGTAGISWLDKGYNSEPVNRYIIAPVDHHVIQYSTSFPPHMWETLENFNVSQDTFQFHAQIQMKPWSNHTFRVLSVNEFGTSLPSHPSQVCSIPPDMPYNNPDNVSVQIINATTSSISWEPMARTEHNGPGFYYNVSSKLDAPEAEWHSQLISEWEQREYQIHNLLPNHKYFITVGAGNDQGQVRSVAKIVECTTPPDIPYKNPETVTAQPINSTTLSVSWEAMPKTDHNGPGFYYNVSWKLDAPEAEWHSQIIPEWEQREYQIHNLLPHHKYFLTVGAGNDQGQTQSIAKFLECTTPPDTPYKNPETVTVQLINSTTLLISWEAMPKTDHNGPGFYYNVSWKLNAPEEEWHSQIIPEWETREYQIHNLLPHHKYFVTVGAGNDQGQTQSIAKLLECTTPPDIPYKSPVNVIIQAIDPKTLSISWEPMTRTEHNGPGFYYNVSWKLDTPEAEWHSQIIPEGEQSEYQIRNLLPNHKYFITVGAGNDQGQARSVAELVECTTPPDIPYKNPDNVTVQAITSTTFTISWKPMPENEHNGPGFHYNVSWKRETPEAVWQSHTIPDWQTQECTVLDAVPYEKYLVTVLAGNNLGKSESTPGAPMKFTTPPDIPYKNPNNVTVYASEPTTLQISWEPMPKTDHNGPNFYYNVLWKKDEPGAEWQIHKISEWEKGQFTISNVLPYEKYLVKVLSGNGQGPATNQTDNSTSSESTSAYITLPCVPFKNPDDVAVQATDPTTVVITWKPMPKTEHNGPGFYYNVWWKVNSTETDWENQTISDWETGKYTVLNALPYEEHLVKVTAGNSQGESTEPPIIVKGYYEEEVPLEALKNLTLVKIISPTSVEISWNRVPMAALRGNFQKYEIEIWSEHDQQKGTVLKKTIEHNFDHTVINQLTPNMKNKIRISVFNGKHQSAFSEELEIDMPEGVPEPVQSLESKPLGSSALSLTWKPPLTTNGNLTRYKIYYQQVSGGESGPLRERTPQITDPNQTQAKLLDLEPDTNYRIHIIATTKAGDGEIFSIEQKTPSPSSALIQPDFQIVPTDSENSTSSVKIVWLPCGTNEKDANNCSDQSIGSEFRVSYRLRGDTDFEEIPERDNDNVIINSLLPNKDYEFMVSSIDGRLLAKSDMKTFKIDALKISTEEPPQTSSKSTTEVVSSILTDAEKLASEQSLQPPTESTNIETVLPKQSSTTQNITSDSSDLTIEPVGGTKNEPLIGWVIVLLAIVFLIVLLITIAIYLNNLTKRNTYTIEEKEIKNGRPDWRDDTETPLSNAEAPDNSSSLPSIQDGSDMVMIPLN